MEPHEYREEWICAASIARKMGERVFIWPMAERGFDFYNQTTKLPEEFVEKNASWYTIADDFEAYEVELAKANTEVKNLLIHTTVPKQYDERLDERDFVANKGAICRGHYIQTGDEYTLPRTFVNGISAVGEEVALDADGKLTKAEGLAIGIVVKLYVWNGQESAMIRFY
jgi:hypothetical protein